jgi:hypothetical protein
MMLKKIKLTENGQQRKLKVGLYNRYHSSLNALYFQSPEKNVPWVYRGSLRNNPNQMVKHYLLSINLSVRMSMTRK